MEYNTDNQDQYKRYIPEKRKIDRSGLWHVVCLSCYGIAPSQAVSYKEAGRILGARRKMYDGVKFWIEQI